VHARSPLTVESCIRSIYREIQVQGRTQPVNWGIGRQFSPDHQPPVNRPGADPPPSLASLP